MAIKVFIDQGHNPESPNAGAEGNGYREQDLVYEIGVRTAALFRGTPGYEARLSRAAPTTILGQSNAESLRIRVAEANAWGATCFLSLHANAAADPGVSGCEGLVFAQGGTAFRLAESILPALAAATGLRNRGTVLRPGLYVLRKTAMPAVLIEMGFISNAGDARRMAEDPDAFARGIYRGTVAFYGEG